MDEEDENDDNHFGSPHEYPNMKFESQLAEGQLWEPISPEGVDFAVTYMTVSVPCTLLIYAVTGSFIFFHVIGNGKILPNMIHMDRWPEFYNNWRLVRQASLDAKKPELFQWLSARPPLTFLSELVTQTGAHGWVLGQGPAWRCFLETKDMKETVNVWA